MRESWCDGGAVFGGRQLLVTAITWGMDRKCGGRQIIQRLLSAGEFDKLFLLTEYSIIYLLEDPPKWIKDNS